MIFLSLPPRTPLDLIVIIITSIIHQEILTYIHKDDELLIAPLLLRSNHQHRESIRFRACGRE